MLWSIRQHGKQTKIEVEYNPERYLNLPFFSLQVIQLEWWPLTRDSLMYSVSVVMLIGVLMDGKVELWEALMLVGAYVFYILGKRQKSYL